MHTEAGKKVREEQCSPRHQPFYTCASAPRDWLVPGRVLRSAAGKIARCRGAVKSVSGFRSYETVVSWLVSLRLLGSCCAVESVVGRGKLNRERRRGDIT